MTVARFSQFPRELAARSRSVRLTDADIPTLLAHPDWNAGDATRAVRPAPVVLWMHGRTANKELDPGRYLRWVRAGLAACAIDMPGHGERFDAALHTPARTLDIIEQALGEIDRVIDALANPRFGGAFDLDRVAIGGMSMGGMTALRRLCDPHEFKAAAVEGTTGWLEGLYRPEAYGLNPVARWLSPHPAEQISRVDPSQHLAGFRPVPLLALHSEADEMVPFEGQRRFIEMLRQRYADAGIDPAMIELVHWPSTGAPQEHVGFGRFSNDAKNAQAEFLKRSLA